MERGSLLGATLLLVSTPAFAQTAEDLRDGGGDVVVTATPLFEPGEDVLVFPAQTASDERVERAGALDLTDYLKRRAGGVFVNEVQGNPLQPDLNYRGFSASPLLGTPQGLSIYIDGVRVNQPFGDVVSWDLIPLSAIRSVTLVPGSNPLFGRNSLGGALSVRTKDGRSDSGVRAEASFGSFDRRVLRVAAGGSGSGLHWFASGDGFEENGWRDRSPSKAGQAFGKLGWAAGGSEVALSGSYAASDLMGNGLQELGLLRRDRSSVYTYPDETRNRAILANLTGTHRFGEGVALSANAFRRRIRTRTLNGDLNEEVLGEDEDVDADACRAGDEPGTTCSGLLNRSRTRQRESGGTAELTLDGAALPGHAITLGLSLVDGRARFGQRSRFGVLRADRGVDGVDAEDDEGEVDLIGRTRVTSAYLLDTVAVAPALRVDVSARFDRTVVRNSDRILADGPGSLSGDHRFHRLNPAASIRWTPTAGLSLDAALAQTSRAPSAIELGCADPESPCRLPNALAGDPPLDQVVARTAEAGVGLERGGWRARAGAFRTVAEDDILFVASPRSGFGYFRNFGRTRRQGLDLDVSGAVGTLELSAHYTLLDATYRGAETVNGAANGANDEGPGLEGNIGVERGDRIPLIPRHLFKAELAWTPTPALTITADLFAASGAYARGNENNEHRPDGVFYLGPGRSGGYVVAGLGVEWRAACAMSVFGRIDNLFDADYATAAQLGAAAFDGDGRFVQRPFTAGADGEAPVRNSTFFAPGAPRAVRVGVRGRF